ncbi:hypothetical protein PG993_009983 [Apiospora rasikravindrae]|uniref:Uncharacterized protein n=1 Tax=Apiospora rasikravindrae TaxID=990691 RepID=A0ABR1SKZ4_9PEZI
MLRDAVACDVDVRTVSGIFHETESFASWLYSLYVSNGRGSRAVDNSEGTALAETGVCGFQLINRPALQEFDAG